MSGSDEGATTGRGGTIFGCSFWAFGAAHRDEEAERCLRALAACCEGTLGGHHGYSVRRFAGAVASSSRGATARIAMRIAAHVRTTVAVTCPHTRSSPARFTIGLTAPAPRAPISTPPTDRGIEVSVASCRSASLRTDTGVPAATRDARTLRRSTRDSAACTARVL